MSLINKIKESRFSALYKLSIRPRARKKLNLILPFLNHGDSILEIGSGNCGLAKLIEEKGFEITASDIVNNSFYPEIKPIVFDGKTLPFNDASFSTVLIITVLHHTSNQKELLQEAKRLGKKIIVMEDVYTHRLGESVMKFTDSVVNLEFRGHPHTNRTHVGWKLFFAEMGFRIKSAKNTRALGYFRQVLYELE